MTMTANRRWLGPLLAVMALLVSACSGGPSAASAAFSEPSPGETVHGALQLSMTADGITIEEAGVARSGAGHFHVLADIRCLTAGTSIGKDADMVHFGGGQSEGVIYLGPGQHELCLQVGDGVHSALDITDTIAVTVEISSRDDWCDVIGEVDELQKEVDGIEEFTAAQIGFENMVRLMDQLLEGIEFVDDEVRADLGEALEFGKQIGQAFVDAADFEAAFEEVEVLYEAAGDEIDGIAGTDWVLATCGVDLED